MKKRILQIIPTLDRCGAEKQMTLLATRLPREEFDVSVAVLTRTGPLEAPLLEAGIPLHFVRKRGKVDPVAYFRLKALIAREQPHLVHTWIFAANAYGRAAARACGVPKIVAAERCADPWKRQPHFWIDRQLARSTDRFVTNSSGVVDFYARNGIPSDRFSIIPNGVAPVEVTDSSRKEHRESVCRELRIDPENLIIGMVARLWPQKRIKEAIWAADQMKFSEMSFHLIIVGDGPERARLLRYRDEVRIRDRVHFLGERDDVSRLMQAFDLLWCTSAYEGQSNAIMEAMAHGVPVLATDIPGNRDLVVDGETGYLIETFGEDFRRRRTRFAQQTHHLLQNEELRKSLSRAAMQRMREQFSIEQMVDRYADFYRSLLDEA